MPDGLQWLPEGLCGHVYLLRVSSQGYEDAREALFGGIKVTWEDEDGEFDSLRLW